MPFGVTSVLVDAFGGEGGGTFTADNFGGEAKATLAATYPEAPQVNAGGIGGSGTGGCNGGGGGANGSGGGGGASDVRPGGGSASFVAWNGGGPTSVRRLPAGLKPHGSIYVDPEIWHRCAGRALIPGQPHG